MTARKTAVFHDRPCVADQKRGACQPMDGRLHIRLRAATGSHRCETRRRDASKVQHTGRPRRCFASISSSLNDTHRFHRLAWCRETLFAVPDTPQAPTVTTRPQSTIHNPQSTIHQQLYKRSAVPRAQPKPRGITCVCYSYHALIATLITNSAKTHKTHATHPSTLTIFSSNIFFLRDKAHNRLSDFFFSSRRFSEAFVSTGFCRFSLGAPSSTDDASAFEHTACTSVIICAFLKYWS